MGVHFHTCELCEATCGLRIETEGDRVVSIRGDHEDPFSRGHICPKAVALRDLHEDPDRLRTPMRKTDRGDFEPVGWDEALDAVADRLHRIQKSDGRDAVAVYLGNPIIHNLGAMMYAPPYVAALGTRNRYSASSVDTHPAFFANYMAFGHQFLGPVPDVDNTDLMVLLGSNPLVSNGSLMTAPGVRDRLTEIARRGGRVVLVDPRRTETAKAVDEHLFIRPGTDAFLLAALVRCAIERGAKLGAHEIRNLDRLARLLEPFEPGDCARRCGVELEVIERLAGELLDTERAIVHGRIGVCLQEFGGLASFLIHALNVVCGNFDKVGGVLFAKPALDTVYPPPGIGVGNGSYDRYRSRVRGWPELGGELPIATLAAEILEGGEGQVRGLLTFAGNPVLSTPNGRELDRALESLDFMASIDFYINETTRHADYILPPVSALQRSHYDAFLYVFAVRNVANFSDPVFPKGDGERHDWEIFAGLHRRLLSRRRRYLRAAGNRLLGAMGPERLLGVGLRMGPHGLFRGGLSLRRLRANPHGVDLGALEPSGLERLPRGHRYIDLAPDPIAADLERLAAALGGEPPELVLIGRRQLRNDNSWLHNAPRMMKGKSRCTLLIHPEDAGKRGIADGDEVEVTSRVGSERIVAELSDEMMVGVVSIPHGFGHNRAGIRLSVAREHPGISVNDLTDDEFVDPLTGAAALNGVPVEVTAFPVKN